MNNRGKAAAVTEFHAVQVQHYVAVPVGGERILHHSIEFWRTGKIEFTNDTDPYTVRVVVQCDRETTWFAGNGMLEVRHQIVSPEAACDRSERVGSSDLERWAG